MLPLTHKVLFLLFAAVTVAWGLHGFLRLYRRIAAGRRDTDVRLNDPGRRVMRALVTTLTQSRTFRKRPVVSFFHSLIFYGFAFYLLVNLVDAIDGFVALSFRTLGVAGNLYVLLADLLSAGVLVGVVALVLRRFLLPSRQDFRFNERTVLHPAVKRGSISLDSLVVSGFILFHVGSRGIGAGAKLAMDGPDAYAPFATLLSHLFTAQNAFAWRIFGYWGALGSVLAFLAYFPRSKHLHIFMAPIKYFVAREESSGELPALQLDMEAEEPKLGASRLEELAWPRLLDAYACIQCNRCQDVCPATATGKSLSPSALEINKRMELNSIARDHVEFERGGSSPHPLLTFALSPEAAWACTTCGACIEVCPVGDEPMLDIMDVRRHQVMIESEFPAQLQTAFRGMERSKNPWGINHEKRLDWAEGLNVKTTDENPESDVLFWVGCAASYDPQAQKTARAFVQLLDHAGVDFAVLGKRECCTGDSARRAGNEYLYRQLADENVATLKEVRPKLIVATCPHCMNSVGKEYKQLGGDFQVMHHTQYLESLVAQGKIVADAGESTITYHDPCYLGRHNGVYDAPRNVLNVLSNNVVELERNRENSFCCGAGGAQFWKEEEAGSERISDNRYREVRERLEGAEDKVLAVGCPFCKSMLESTPGKGTDPIAIKDIAELLLEGVQRGGAKTGMEPTAEVKPVATFAVEVVAESFATTVGGPEKVGTGAERVAIVTTAPVTERKKWTPASKQAVPTQSGQERSTGETLRVPSATSGDAREQIRASGESPRKSWTPKKAISTAPAPSSQPQAGAVSMNAEGDVGGSISTAAVGVPAPRKAWKPKHAVAQAEEVEKTESGKPEEASAE